MRVESSELVAQIDVADRFDVRPSAVANWRSRHSDFPEPIAVVARANTALWRLKDIEAWASTVTAPNALKRGRRSDLPRVTHVSPEQVAEMRKLRDNDKLSLRQVGAVFGVSHETVRQLTGRGA